MGAPSWANATSPGCSASLPSIRLTKYWDESTTPASNAMAASRTTATFWTHAAEGENRNAVVVGRIALARFPAGTRLETSDGNHFIAPAGVVAQNGFATERGFAPLVPMHRERSRVDIDESLIRLKDAYLAFDALQAAEAARAHLGKTAMDLLK